MAKGAFEVSGEDGAAEIPATGGLSEVLTGVLVGKAEDEVSESGAIGMLVAISTGSSAELVDDETRETVFSIGALEVIPAVGDATGESAVLVVDSGTVPPVSNPTLSLTASPVLSSSMTSTADSPVASPTAGMTSREIGRAHV